MINKAITLIELMAVIIIMVILAVIVTPNVVAAANNAKAAAMQATLSQLQSAVDQFYMEKGVYPTYAGTAIVDQPADKIGYKEAFVINESADPDSQVLYPDFIRTELPTDGSAFGIPGPVYFGVDFRGIVFMTRTPESLWTPNTIVYSSGNQSGESFAQFGDPNITGTPTSIFNIPLPPTFSWGTVYPDAWITSPAPLGIWNYPVSKNSGYNAPNAVPIIFSTVINTTTSTINIQIKDDDTSEMYIDGTPYYLTTGWDSLQNFNMSVSPGHHTIQFFAANIDGSNTYTWPNPMNPAILNVVIKDANGNVLSTTDNTNLWSAMQPSVLDKNYLFEFGYTNQGSSGLFDQGQAVYGTDESGKIPVGPASLIQ